MMANPIAVWSSFLASPAVKTAMSPLPDFFTPRFQLGGVAYGLSKLNAEREIAVGGESTEAWRAVLDDLIHRGLRRPEFLVTASPTLGLLSPLKGCTCRSVG